jgi:hypothetical protein
MGLFDNLMSKIFSRSSGTAGASASSVPPTTTSAAQSSQPSTAPSAGSGGGAATATQQVDVTAILDGLAAKNREKLDWRHSIVDLMKLVGMDSSLNARKQLATELHYSGDQNDSASMNVWLHKEVIQRLAENGGKVPQELLK